MLRSFRIKISGILIIFSLTPQAASADSYTLFSKHEEMKAHVVADAGDFEKITSSSDGLSTMEILKLNSNCFRPTGSLGSWGYGKKAGLVLVDRNKTISIAFIESSIGSIKVDTLSALQIPCPTEDSGKIILDSQQRLQELRRQQEQLRLQLERLRQQQQQLKSP